MVENHNFDKLKSNFLSHLYLPDDEYLDVVFATVLANRIQGDPVWLFVIGSPGSCKTEVLRTLETEETYQVSKIRAASLISGYVDNRSKTKDVDHSLLPKIHKKVLIVKDFSTVITMRQEERNEIFSILRDAYDGYATVSFGTGEKGYKSKFGMIAAMTPVIEGYRTLASSLGERFLYFNPKVGDPQRLCMAAIDSIHVKDSMREQLSNAAKDFLENDVMSILPLSADQKSLIISLADTTAIIRSHVPRDHRDYNTVLMPPIIEVATRISQQIIKMFYALEHLGSDSIRLIKRILCDCVPVNRRLICEHIIAQPNITTTMLQQNPDIDISTKALRIILSDLTLLGLIDRSRVGRGEYSYTAKQGVVNLFS